jgi:hypothetical protein
MASPTQPRINGNRYAFSSVELVANGRRYKGVKEIKYDDSLEPERVRGTSPNNLGVTQGDYDANASITLYREEFDQLTNDLGDGYGEIEFEVTVTYANRGAPTVVDRLPAVRIKKVDNSNAQGPEALEVPLELCVIDVIERNGKRLVRRDQ